MHQEFCPPYPMEQIKNHEHDQHHHLFSFGLNHQIVSSCVPTQDHAGFYHPQLFQPHHHPQDKYYGYGGGSSHEGENKIEVKKVKVKLKLNPSSSFSTNNTSSYHSNTTIRVCSDCHTTKTPLWRSGPKGPKSLCNACGIRQRKARRAMAAAKTGNGGRVASEQMKECCKLGVGSSTSSGKKMGFEDFLINLSNKIAFHRVFPQDEKEAAILLMALSSGLVHG